MYYNKLIDLIESIYDINRLWLLFSSTDTRILQNKALSVVLGGVCVREPRLLEQVTGAAAAMGRHAECQPVSRRVRFSCGGLMSSAQRKRRICAAQIATRLVCIEQYISTGIRPQLIFNTFII